ncbi:hypothetical protein F0562_031026 [Nyssa sinensis]|uniref:Uncharacterized protein n=1 Tax=Nyssa sinensis TaxID=561372 RepID=A0A5J5ASH4_9ASTE|nr:hypothetical protein F0562_031026 [Nyssa sinensis]
MVIALATVTAVDKDSLGPGSMSNATHYATSHIWCFVFDQWTRFRLTRTKIEEIKISLCWRCNHGGC